MNSRLNKNRRFLLSFTTVFLCLFVQDCLFRYFAFGFSVDIILVRLFLFDYALALFLALLASLLPEKIGRFLLIVVVFFLSIYGIVQLGFKNFMGNYMSIKASLDGAGRVTQNVPEFIMALEPHTLLILVPSIITAVILSRKHSKRHGARIRPLFAAVVLVLALIIHGAGLLTLSLLQEETSLVSPLQLYQEPQPQELALSELGVNRFAWRDGLTVFQEEKNVIVVEEEGDWEPEISVEDKRWHRLIDDTRWQSLADAETNEAIHEIDAYLMNREITDYNEMTGYFEGKNFIYIMVEAFDYMAVDEQLTPTLYRMKNEGWDFTHYYTPKYSCTTAESEFIGLTSLVPASNVCTPNTYKDNQFTQALFQLFNRKGYTSTSYHNWNDQFYERKIYHLNMGSSAFYSIEDMSFKVIQGWQSDVDLVNEALQHFPDQEPFFAFMITSSMHFPYDESSTLGDRYLDEVKAVYPDAPINIQRYLSKSMELDKAMAVLLQQLSQKGILRDTVIALFADHHPLKTEQRQIAAYTQELNRLEGLNIDRTPFFLYTPGIVPQKFNQVASTYDLVPTLANLFNLDFDPRFYVGTDLFSQKGALVIFNNGDWITEEGIYYARKKSFVPFEEDTQVDEAWIQNQNNRVNNLFSISKEIYRTDYFQYRDFNIVIQQQE